MKCEIHFAEIYPKYGNFIPVWNNPSAERPQSTIFPSLCRKLGVLCKKSESTMEIRRIFDILENYQEHKPGNYTALAAKDGNGVWRSWSLQEYVESVDTVASALVELGLQPGDRVAIISTNRPEWNILDMAVMKVGCITVPVYPNISAEEYHYILDHSGARLAVVEGAEVMQKIERLLPELPALERVFTFRDRGRFPYWEQLLQLGACCPHPEEVTVRAAEVQPGQCSTIMYTSGTTGTPKGVMLSHSNIVSQLMNLYPTMAVWSHTALSFLPLCHAYERMLVFLYQFRGLSVYYARNLGTIAEDIRTVHPTMMSTVPLMLEKMHDRICLNGRKKKGPSRWIFNWAERVACRYRIEETERSLWYRMQHALAEKLVYRRIREGIGGDFDIIVSGSAMIQPQLVSFFSAIGLPVYEGYGMTEASPVIAVSCNARYGREAGTVGFPLPGVEIAFTDEHELICRGHNVMMGYYRNEELTRRTIDAEGWLHTGDIGRFTDKGQVVITGRLKSLFKSSLGKYINAAFIEAKCAESPFVGHIVAVGENRRFVSAVISPAVEPLKAWCRQHSIVLNRWQDALKEKKVLELFQQEINRSNRELNEAEKVKKFTLVADEWNVDNGMLSPTMKVRRHAVEAHYRDLIYEMYGEKKDKIAG